MFSIKNAEAEDLEFWLSLDRHISADEYNRKVHDSQAYIIAVDGVRAGVLRYNLFWDSIPFCTMLYIAEEYRGRGYGRELMRYWEAEMKSEGCGMVMTSTQSDENAQHFYRRIGYKDCGCLVMDIPGYEQPMEIILSKPL